MADRNERVMEMVRRELERDPGVGLDALLKRAVEIDPSVGELSRRQFHARYPLQVKRGRRDGGAGPKRGGAPRQRGRAAAKRRSPEPSPAPRAPRGGGFDRDAVRGVFLEFASDFAEAESRQEIVRVLSSVDQYVERVRRVVDGK